MSFYRPDPQILATDPSGAGPIGSTAVSIASGNYFYVNPKTGNWQTVGGSSGPTSLSWTALTLANSWGFPANGGPTGGAIQGGRYAIDSFNVVHLDGVITTGTVTTNTVVFTLPSGFRPAAQMFIQTPNGNGGTGSFFLLPSGDFEINTGIPGGGFFITLTGITFPIN